MLHAHLLGLIAVSDGDVVSGVVTRFRSLLHCSQLGAFSIFFSHCLFLGGHSFPSTGELTNLFLHAFYCHHKTVSKAICKKLLLMMIQQVQGAPKKMHHSDLYPISVL